MIYYLFPEGRLPAMHKTMNVWVLIGISVCILVAFFCYSGSLNSTIQELNDTYESSSLRLASMKDERTELKNTLETVGTDAFIENQARTLYGYMMPDEIRFEIIEQNVSSGSETPSK